jgi:hypothetical protein
MRPQQQIPLHHHPKDKQVDKTVVTDMKAVTMESLDYLVEAAHSPSDKVREKIRTCFVPLSTKKIPLAQNKEDKIRI